MLLPPLDSITIDHLKRLVTDGIAERREIEYKEKLPGATDEAKKEFLRDVSSFANAVGGHLIYGVRDRAGPDGRPTGIPDAVVGLGARTNAGAAINSLENSIRTGIEPRLFVAAKEVAGAPVGSLIVFHIPRSYSSPHMVTLGGDDGFYTRSSAGKYKLSVDEIRSAFIGSDSLGERLRHFRRERVARIIAGGAPVPLEPGSRIVLHIIPFIAESGVSRVSVSMMDSQVERLPPLISGQGWDPRFNLEGYATFGSRDRRTGQAYGYTQVFRTGALESVDAITIGARDGRLVIPGAVVEKRVIEGLGKYLPVMKNFGLPPPLMVAVTVLGVRGAIMAEDLEPHWYREPQPINHDDLLLPELVVEDYGVDPARVLRPALDTLWQAAGWPGSVYFKDDGSWDPNIR